MIRLLVIVALASIACRMIFGKWPWAYLRAPDRAGARLTEARALLGVGKRASREEIVRAHRRRIATIHPDRGGSNALVHETNEARDLLLKQIDDSEGAGKP